MPLARKVVKRTYKKKGKRFRKKPYKSSPYSVMDASKAISQFQFVKMNYNQNITITSVNGAIKVHQFRLGSFRPDLTTVGHQPYFYDTYAGLYQRSVIYGAKVTLTCTSAGGMMVCMRGAVTNTIPATYNLEQERPYSIERTFTAGGQSQVLKYYYNIPKLYGITKKQILTDDLYSQDTNATQASIVSPVNNTYLNISTRTADLATTSTLNVSVNIVYYAKFYERLAIAQS